MICLFIWIQKVFAMTDSHSTVSPFLMNGNSYLALSCKFGVQAEQRNEADSGPSISSPSDSEAGKH